MCRILPRTGESNYFISYKRLGAFAKLATTYPFAIRCLPEDAPRYAVVMGSGGGVFGLAVYETLADLQLMFTSSLSPRQLAKRATWFVLFFEEAPAVSFEDLDAIAAYKDWSINCCRILWDGARVPFG